MEFLLKTILLAEDDQRLACLVQSYLERHDYRVVIESQGYNVVRLVEELNPDLVILDLGLPGKDGLTICRELREFYQDPILMLTARDSDMDQVLGLEFGADDYVNKPAEPRVLLARIRALLRRRENHKHENHSSRHEFGELQVDTPSRSVSLSGEEISLTSHEFDLLCAFLDKHGQVLSREYLFNTIYRRPYDGLDRTIDVRISQLRKKLGDSADDPQKIKTIWGKGYLFVAEAW
jgi:DNA-binding response OmpR family regulator